MGIALNSLNVPREDLVVSTKIFWGNPSPSRNNQGLNRKHVKEGVKASLARMNLTYFDVVFCHRFDPETPLEEIARAYTELIQQGLIHYWGTSEWSAANIFELREICEAKNLIKPIVEQPQYNMFVRDSFEKDYGRLFDIHKMGSTVWSPLCGGILTGKYNEGGIPEGARWNTFNENPYLKGVWNKFFEGTKKDALVKILKGLATIAAEIGATQPQLAMAWVIANKDVSTAITGCSKIEQLEEVVKAVQIYHKITPEVSKKIEDLLGNRPDFGTDFKTWQPVTPRR